MLQLADKHFKVAIINMSKDIKSKDLKGNTCVISNRLKISEEKLNYKKE